jgi:hypothetical protein
MPGDALINSKPLSYAYLLTHTRKTPQTIPESGKYKQFAML